jgi:hypothetical protein
LKISLQIADALRGLIGQGNRRRTGLRLNRRRGPRHADHPLRNGVLVGLSDTTSAGSRPGNKSVWVEVTGGTRDPFTLG